MEFTLDQQKLIYSAVRYYQMNRVPHDGSYYRACDEILNGMFNDVKMNTAPVPPTPPVNGFGFNT